MDNKERITYASSELFNKYGYKNVTVDQIASKTGMSKKTLYKYFSSKEEMAGEVLNYFMERIDSKKESILMAPNLSPDLRICNYILKIKEDLSIISPLFLEDIKKYMPDVWMKFYQKQKETVYALESFIKEGQTVGTFKDINTNLVVQIILSAVLVVMEPNFLIKNNLTQEEVYDAVTTIFLSGLSNNSNL